MKKTLTFILVCILVFSCGINALALADETEYTVPTRNDVNDDGTVDVQDILLVLKNFLNGVYTTKYDINRDGVLSFLDTLFLMRLAIYSPSSIVMSEKELYDKVLGGWIGQMVGVAWAASTEFHYRGKIIPEEEIPTWTPEMVNSAFGQDDLYVEIPFLDAMVENGVDCDGKYLAEKFRDSEFQLWHANLQARNNLKNGIEYPLSGHYLYNNHADDIDWQIESDFLGMMYPGLVNQAAARAFELGHIMNYGDGVYGGVFVSAMHSAAFTANSVDEIIDAGLAVIPEGTTFKELLNDVMACYENGDTWQEAWQMLEDKWTYTDRCLTCIGAINIDAKLNAGYILIGLLYGNGDFAETIKISMQCGQDSDCNPSSAASILGNYYGASGIPEIYTQALDYNSRKFDYTDYTFNDAMEINLSLLREALTNSGFTCSPQKSWLITPDTEYVTVPFEQWEETVIADLEVTTPGGMAAQLSLHPADITKIKAVSVDMGDGFVSDNQIVHYTYQAPGTYTVRYTITGEDGATGTVTQEVVIENPEVGTADLRVPGIAFCSVTAPTGSGNKNISIIYDGATDEVGSTSNNTQYDTYMGGVKTDSVHAGLTFNCSAKLDGVTFTEGKHFGDGGWFAEQPDIEVLVDGEWVAAPCAISPAYPANDRTAQGQSFESYTFTFDAPVTCDGVRVVGAPGGRAYFISISEITPIVSEIYNDPRNAIILCSVAAPTGSGSKDFTVICDTIVPDAASAVPTMQLDTYSGGKENAEAYIGYLFRDVRTVSKLIYSEGGHFKNGGWWKDGQVYVEALVNGAWVRTECTVSPAYPSGDTASLFGDGYETYTLTLSEPVACDGIRLYGIAGGTSGFISVSELVVK